MRISLRGFDVRPATETDIPRILELEQTRFGADGVVPLTEEHIRCWLEINPTGLLVVEQAGRVVAYRYSQYLDFELPDISRLTTHDAFTDGAFTRRTHKPDGNSINGVTVASGQSGAGRVLFEVIFRQLVEQKRRYYFGFARIPGFADYYRHAVAAGLPDECTELDVATGYAFACASCTKGAVWPHVPLPRFGKLPKPTERDPVLCKYLLHQGFGIAAVLPNWMQDTRSRNMGVMVLYKNPDIAGL